MTKYKTDVSTNITVLNSLIASITLVSVLLVVALIFNWRASLYRRISVEQDVQIVEWTQYSQLNGEDEGFSTELGLINVSPIISNRWDFDYWPIEPLIQKVRLDVNRQLVLDEDIASILSAIVSVLPPGLDQENLSRLRYLIEINVSGSSGQELAQLVENFYRYHTEFSEWENSNTVTSNFDSSGVGSSEARYRQSLKIMQESIGRDKTELIFGRQHALSEYLYQRRRVNTNQLLSSQEKEALLAELEKQYREPRQ